VTEIRLMLTLIFIEQSDRASPYSDFYRTEWQRFALRLRKAISCLPGDPVWLRNACKAINCLLTISTHQTVGREPLGLNKAAAFWQ